MTLASRTTKPKQPTKPRLTERVISPWSIPVSVAVFNTDEQIHHAMSQYAEQLSPAVTEMDMCITFNDGSQDIVQIQRETKSFSYKTFYHAEEYEETYFGTRWHDPSCYPDPSLYSTSPKQAVLRGIPKSMRGHIVTCEPVAA
jgi:hypothetical protein